MKNQKNEAGMDWDFGDIESTPKKGPPPIPGKKPVPLKVTKISGPAQAPNQRPPSGYLPGVNNPNSPMRPGSKKSIFGKKKETAVAGSLAGYQAPTEENEAFPDRRSQQPRQQAQQQIAPQQNRRARRETMPVAWEVTVPGNGTYKVEPPPGSSLNSVKDEFIKWWQENEQTPIDPNKIHIIPWSGQNEKLEAFRIALNSKVNEKINEIIRKKEGGGGFNLYSPNKGKKKPSKLVGTFPTRLAAKQAELARFPPKDPEQFKKARARLDKLSKNPKKRIEKEKEDLTGVKKAKRSGAPVRSRKKVKEEFISKLTSQLTERLFSDEEVPGSPWDERIADLNPDSLSSDKKLHGYHKGIEKASIGALSHAHKGLSKALRGLAVVNPGDHGFDPVRRKMFIPVTLDCDGTEIGPVHLYVDGGHVKIEISKEARNAIAAMEPDDARNLRGGLMSFQEDHLPEIDVARKAWSDRDAYLDKLHSRLEKQFNGMSGVEHHIAKSLINKRRHGR